MIQKPLRIETWELTQVMTVLGSHKLGGRKCKHVLARFIPMEILVVTPRAYVAGLSNWFCLSVCRLSTQKSGYLTIYRVK